VVYLNNTSRAPSYLFADSRPPGTHMTRCKDAFAPSLRVNSVGDEGPLILFR